MKKDARCICMFVLLTTRSPLFVTHLLNTTTTTITTTTRSPCLLRLPPPLTDHFSYFNICIVSCLQATNEKSTSQDIVCLTATRHWSALSPATCSKMPGKKDNEQRGPNRSRKHSSGLQKSNPSLKTGLIFVGTVHLPLQTATPLWSHKDQLDLLSRSLLHL